MNSYLESPSVRGRVFLGFVYTKGEACLGYIESGLSRGSRVGTLSFTIWDLSRLVNYSFKVG